MSTSEQTNHSADSNQQNEKKYLDPVCGMQVAKNPEKMASFQGRIYYFCSASCVGKFTLSPSTYVKEKKLLGALRPTSNSTLPAPSQTPAPTSIAETTCCGSCSTEEVAESGLKDLVCGMTVTEQSPHHTQYQGKDYYFCAQRCLDKFQKNPENYLNPPAKPAATTADKNAIYTCPMHLEIEQVGPGTCPLCGMALEPKEASAIEDTSELDDMWHRFKWSLSLSLPLLLLTMLDMLPSAPVHNALGMQVFNYLQFVLATPVVLWAGWPFTERAIASFKTGHLNMFSLIGVGTAAAYFYSLVALLFPQLLPDAFKMDGMAPLYFEAAAVIITLVLLGQILELRARSQTNAAIKSLLALTPETTLRINADGSESSIALDQVQIGDLLRVKPGTHIPVDGSLVDGESYVDEAMITGEPIPVHKRSADPLVAGTINQQGTFSMRAERVGRDTLLAKIIDMVNQAGRSRAPIQKLADQISAWFVPGVIASALLAFALWAWLGPTPSLANGLMAAVSVLIIACPCALGLATPISVTAGIGRAATEGILINDAEALERLEKIDTLVIDKTGTLTEGKPRLQEVLLTSGLDETNVLSLALGLEQSSEHPVARAIVDYAQHKQIQAAHITGFQAISGKGVRGLSQNKVLVFGNEQLLRDENINFAPQAKQIEELKQRGHTVMLLAADSEVIGIFSVADSVKTSSQQAIQELQSAGIRIILLTGDNAITASAIGKQLGLDEVHAEMLPEGKFHFVQKLQANGKLVAMAGDGINDAPALAQANIGIAMGNGTDIAMHSAHVVLVKGDLRGIYKVLQLSRATMKNIRQNLFFAFAYNFIGVPIAAGIFYPWFGIVLSPMIASAAMSLSSVSVISNALRLRHLKFRQ